VSNSGRHAHVRTVIDAEDPVQFHRRGVTAKINVYGTHRIQVTVRKGIVAGIRLDREQFHNNGQIPSHRCTDQRDQPLLTGAVAKINASKKHTIAPDTHKIAVSAYELASADATATDAVIAYPNKQ
jgi:hypothetical protein